MVVGIPIFLFFYALVGLGAFLLPIVIGYAYVRADAERIGQPGWLWALLTIPLGWLALLGYAIARAVVTSRA